MKKSFLSAVVILFSGMCCAHEIAECHGTSDLDGLPVIAKVYAETDGGRIVITTSIDTIESRTQIQSSADGSVRIFQNDFQMNFTVSPAIVASPVEAFRGGEFFVDDFTCSLVN